MARKYENIRILGEILKMILANPSVFLNVHVDVRFEVTKPETLEGAQEPDESGPEPRVLSFQKRPPEDP